MKTRQRRGRPRASLPSILLLALLVCLAIAGGASRGDVLGQAIVRVAAAAVIAGLILGRATAVAELPRWPAALLLAIVALPLVQLVPLPPAIWPHLPGREAFLEAAAIAGSPQPWRPLAVSPDAAGNALFSLLVPAAALLAAAALSEAERARVPGFVLAFATVSATLAVAQLSGGGIDNPLINETVGTASGIFANPNHQALLLAIGIVAGGAWAADRREAALWRIPIAGGAAIWLLLMIMASGSRTGLALGFLALSLSIVIAKRPIATLLMRVPPRTRWLIIGVGLVGVVALAVITFTAGRAVSLNRLLVLSTGEDMRSRALPTVLAMVGTYMPFGSGFGSFDPLFRMVEPYSLLKLTYFNHAHNDYLEVALEGGVLGVALIVVAIGWAVRAGVATWRADPSDQSTMPARFGATVLLLVALSSAVDYPARTPTIMALVAVAAVLTGRLGQGAGRDALRFRTDRV